MNGNNGIEITIKFELNLNKLIKFPEDVTIEEIEKYLLSLFLVQDKNLDVLQTNQKKLSKIDKLTKLSNTKYNEFIFDIGKVLDNLLNNDYTKEIETPSLPCVFIPSFCLKFDIDDENNFLGEGSFGKVYKCSFKSKNLAVKFKNNQNLDLISNREIPNNVFEREINSYKSLKHINLPTFRGVTYFSIQGKGILMEYIEGKSLDKLQKVLTDINKFDLLYQLADLLSYLHENGIIHRDIKPNNLLIETKTNLLKLIDFGTSKIEDQFNDIKLNTIKSIFDYSNSVYYFRYLLKKESQIDVWSFGCMCYFLFTGKHPWNGNTILMNNDITNKILFYEKDEILKKNLIIYDIVDLCCNYNNTIEINFNSLKNKFAVLKDVFALSKNVNQENTLNLLREIYIPEEQVISKPIAQKKCLKDHLYQTYSYLNEKMLFSEDVYYLKKQNIKSDLTQLQIELEDTLNKNGEDFLSAHIYYLIGLIYYINKDTKSIEYFKKSISNYECLLDETYALELATSLLCLGCAYLQCNNIQESVSNLTECLTIREKVLGENHVSLSNVYEKLIEVYNSTNNVIEVNYLIEKALNIRILAEFDKKDEVADNYLKISSLLFLKKEYFKAIDYSERALELNLSELGEYNFVAAQNKFQIAEIYSVLSKYNLAREKYIEAIRIYERLLGNNNSKSEKCYFQISMNYLTSQEYEKAIEGFLKCVTLRSTFLDESDYANVILYKLMGECYCKLLKYEESVEYYYKALSIYILIFGTNHAETQSIQNEISKVMEKSNMFK